ncbi:MAG: sensor histidine kinase [Atopobiaceae bacterium]|jgi:two-component system sensor histidine kinase CiaH
MFTKLRRKLVAMILVMVGTVFVVLFSTSLFTQYRTQQLIISQALQRTMHGKTGEVTSVVPLDGNNTPNLLAICVDMDASGVVLQTNVTTLAIDAQTLKETLVTILNSNDRFGTISDLHVAWEKKLLNDGTYRVAIIDTSGMAYQLKHQVTQDALIVLVGLVVLAVISWVLSGWILKPTRTAWDQQHRFISDASHELKTPLAVIIANNEILLKDEHISAESKRWLTSTQEESTHMKRLVEELLELARADEDQLVEGGIARRDVLNFSDIVDSATLEFDVVAFERGVEIEADIEPDISVTGDEDWVSRMVRILLDNACKYARPGTKVSVKLSRMKNRRCMLTVNNQGDVIAAEDLSHIFDRFYRTDKARARSSRGGFGLGLAIAKSIVVSTGGNINATSSQEDGTTFRVCLPQSPKNPLAG